MPYKLDQIVLENEKAFCIALDNRHFECYEIGVTHSVRKAQIITDKGVDYVKSIISCHGGANLQSLINQFENNKTLRRLLKSPFYVYNKSMINHTR